MEFQNISEANATGNSSTRNDSLVLYPLTEAYRFTGFALFSTIFVVGTVLNSCIIYIVLRWPGMRTPCNYFLMNIAIADLAVAMIVSPLRMTEFFAPPPRWILGESLCHILAPIQDVFVTVSAITYTALTVERYRVIVTPFKPKMSLKGVVITCGLIWLACYLTSALPIAILLRYRSDAGGNVCAVDWPSFLYFQIFDVHVMISFIAGPVIIQTWAYYNLLKSLPQPDIMSSNGREAQTRRKLVNMLLIIVVIFQVCYIPRGVMMLLVVFGKVSFYNVSVQYARLIVFVMYYLKHIANPVVLFSISAEFRSHFKRLFRCRH